MGVISTRCVLWAYLWARHALSWYAGGKLVVRSPRQRSCPRVKQREMVCVRWGRSGSDLWRTGEVINDILFSVTANDTACRFKGMPLWIYSFLPNPILKKRSNGLSQWQLNWDLLGLNGSDLWYRRTGGYHPILIKIKGHSTLKYINRLLISYIK